MERIQFSHIIQQLNTNKVILLSGPRLAGKEIIAQRCIQEYAKETLQIDLGNKKERKVLEEASAGDLVHTFKNFQLVVIHEAQYLSNLQTIIEEVLSGSIESTLLLTCSFEPLLDELLKEVLDLQQLHFKILPLSFYELAQANGLPKEEKLLEQRIIYGNYASVIESLENAKEILEHLLDTIIVTDLGVTDRINKR